MTEIKDLWPQALVDDAAVTPLEVLRVQASSLTERMKGVVQGIVVTELETSGPLHAQTERIRHELRLVVPALDRYQYVLLTAFHEPVIVYPVTIAWRHGPDSLCRDRDEFERSLSHVFAHGATRTALTSFVAQSKQMQAPRLR